jgi:deazaflavin-dependent oxidoreductase (nitroreductase family)
MSATTTTAEDKGWLPPRVIVRLAWITHRAIHRFSGGRRGLALARPGKEGFMRLRTVGRKTGRERIAILAYFEDGPNLVTMAMNGWADPEPAWWLNLLAHPDAEVDLKDRTMRVRARPAEGDERTRLWAALDEHNGWGGSIDAYALRRSRETAVVVLEPVGAAV